MTRSNFTASRVSLLLSFPALNMTEQKNPSPSEEELKDWDWKDKYLDITGISLHIPSPGRVTGMKIVPEGALIRFESFQGEIGYWRVAGRSVMVAQR